MGLKSKFLAVGLIALPPPPTPPFDIETLEPLGVPPQWGWSDEIEAPPVDWWTGPEPIWEAPELALDEERILVLDADDPVAADEWPVYTANER